MYFAAVKLIGFFFSIDIKIEVALLLISDLLTVLEISYLSNWTTF